MGVRVRTKIRSLRNDSYLEVNSLLNTGFETGSPHILVPIRVGELLKFWPHLPDGAEVKAYETAGGMTRMYEVPNSVEIQVLAEDKTSDVVKCDLIISEIEREVLLSDMTIDKLEIIIESPAKGLWRFKDDSKVKGSVDVQYW